MVLISTTPTESPTTCSQIVARVPSEMSQQEIFHFDKTAWALDAMEKKKNASKGLRSLSLHFRSLWSRTAERWPVVWESTQDCQRKTGYAHLNESKTDTSLWQMPHGPWLASQPVLIKEETYGVYLNPAIHLHCPLPAPLPKVYDWFCATKQNRRVNIYRSFCWHLTEHEILCA